MIHAMMKSFRVCAHMMLFFFFASGGSIIIENAMGAPLWKASGIMALALYSLAALFDKESVVGGIFYAWVEALTEFVCNFFGGIRDMWISFTTWDWLFLPDDQQQRTMHFRYSPDDYKTDYKKAWGGRSATKYKPFTPKKPEPPKEESGQFPVLPSEKITLPIVSAQQNGTKIRHVKTAIFLEWREKRDKQPLIPDPAVGSIKTAMTELEVTRMLNVNLFTYIKGYKLLLEAATKDKWLQTWIERSAKTKLDIEKYDYYLQIEKFDASTNEIITECSA